MGTIAYTFPLIARYENDLKSHLRNALFLSIAQLPKTIVMLVLYALPILIAISSLAIFFSTLIIWILIGIGLIIYAQTKLLLSTFRKLEHTPDAEPAAEE